MSRVLLILFCLASTLCNAQKDCSSTIYEGQLKKISSTVAQNILAAESFIKNYRPELISGTKGNPAFSDQTVITIPVVVHILYKDASQNIPQEKIKAQIEILNNAFRYSHPDSVKIPYYYKSLATDSYIQFALARVDPDGRATNGIVRKNTWVTLYGIDDRIKFSDQGGDDAWDCNQYLNIWVGALAGGLAGYSSPVGGPKERDGVAVKTDAFGPGNGAPYNGGKTLVHEVGHWLGLKHIWGDAYCGDDGVDDTPPQQTSNRGCPSGIKITCNNGPYGDMYMNYMDLSNDDCMLMFTKGQISRMRSLFAPAGPRNQLLNSKGYSGNPLPALLPPPSNDSNSNHVLNVFPNPATAQLQVRLPGENISNAELKIYDQFGRVVKKILMDKSGVNVDVSNLPQGVYFIKVARGKLKYEKKFIKL